jgi:hypothetical protein
MAALWVLNWGEEGENRGKPEWLARRDGYQCSRGVRQRRFVIRQVTQAHVSCWCWDERSRDEKDRFIVVAG